MKKGFTLAEILVVLAVLSLMGVLVVTIFTRSLRGANKSQILSSIKQNGQAVLEVMDKIIRGADDLVCVSGEPGNNTIVLEKAGIYTRYRFVTDSTGMTNGVILRDLPVPTSLEIDPRLFVNRVCNPADPLSQTTTLSDINPQTGVSILSGSFTKDTQDGFKPVITVMFVLGPGIEAPKAIAGQIDPVTFQTTIQLR